MGELKHTTVSPPAGSYLDLGHIKRHVSVGEAVRACRRLRDFERVAFSEDRCSAAGLAAAQCRLLLLRCQIGVPVRDGELAEARLALQGFLESEP